MSVPTEILFYAEEGGRGLPSPEPATAAWINDIVNRRGGRTGSLSFIFCGDDYLHRINLEYLAHDTLTDIVTFPYADFPLVSGDLFISTERVADNAAEFGEAYPDELHRVMAHGILHLCGQGDKEKAEADRMRELERWALDLRPPELLSAA